MPRILIIIGGIVNLLLTAFHIRLGSQIQASTSFSACNKALVVMLNVGSILIIAFFAVVSFVYLKDLLTTRLGKATCCFIALFYLVRGTEEFIYPPVKAWILIVSMITMALYIIPLVINGRQKAAA
jgi:hypothetical protein